MISVTCSGKPVTSNTNKKEFYSITFHELMELVLSFQLTGHIRFLAKFRNLFRMFDNDDNGTLDHDQSVDLLVAVNPDLSPDVVMEILNAADPSATRSFTFSQCVGIVSSHMVRR